MATLLDLETRVGAKLGMDPANVSDEKTLIDSWINAGRDRVLLLVRPHVAIAELDLAADEGDYDLPPEVLALNEFTIALDDDTPPMQRVAPARILALRRYDDVDLDDPRYFALDGDKLMIYPTPSSARVVTFYYVPQVTDLSAPTHDPSNVTYGGIPKIWHYAIELWACAQAGDQDDDQSSAQGQRYRQEFLEEIKTLRRWQIRRGGRRLPRVEIP